MVSRPQVELCLSQIRECWPPSCFVANRDKNNQALAALNMTPKQRKDLIFHLTPADYVSGPELNRSRGGRNIWVFGKEIDGTEVYIKMTLFTVRSRWYASCISFHPAEEALSYPFRERLNDS